MGGSSAKTSGLPLDRFALVLGASQEQRLTSGFCYGPQARLFGALVVQSSDRPRRSWSHEGMYLGNAGNAPYFCFHRLACHSGRPDCKASPLSALERILTAEP